jgi:hypothetical protein
MESRAIPKLMNVLAFCNLEQIGYSRSYFGAFSVSIESERAPRFSFDAFSSREPWLLRLKMLAILTWSEFAGGERVLVIEEASS